MAVFRTEYRLDVFMKRIVLLVGGVETLAYFSIQMGNEWKRMGYKVFYFDLENDVYFQIGLVMLVGLAAKNAILIVEFAKEQVDKGVDVVQAALHASQLRFRPILMTSLAFILGMLPMVIASGPGFDSRQAIGTGVFFGMIVAVTVGIVLVPFFFVQIYKMTAKMIQK